MPGSISPGPGIRSGHQNHSVPTLQYLLRARGHSVTVDGAFGPDTEAAVRAFQTSKGLSADGIVGPQTWAALVVQVQKGSSGDAVRGCRRSSSSGTCPATPARGFRWTGSSGRRRTERCGAFSRRFRSTCPRWPWTGSWVRSLGGRSSAACWQGSARSSRHRPDDARIGKSCLAGAISWPNLF